VKIKIRTTEDGNVVDREYDSPERFTYREKRLIKDVTRLAGFDWIEAVDRFDDDVALGLAAVALHRAGRFPGVDEMLDMEIESIELDYSDELEELEKAVGGGPPAEAEAAEGDGKPRKSSGASAKSKTRRRSGTPS
jgi:hypothetical protein